MAEALPDTALDQLFRSARSYNGWLDKDVGSDQLHAIYELMTMGPTSANQQPARIVWCKSPEAKQRLETHIARMKREARVHFAGEAPKGNYVAPHVFELADADQLTEEVFGPILHVVRYPAEQLDRLLRVKIRAPQEGTHIACDPAGNAK